MGAYANGQTFRTFLSQIRLCAAQRSAAVVFSALITLLAAAGVALPVLRCVPCTACTAMRARRTAVLVGRGH